MEWRTRWYITIRWDRADNSPTGVSVVERVVDSPADLGRLIRAARADPHVVAFPYRSTRELVGDEPTECHNGHGYAGGSATWPIRGWWPCRCGGHLILQCRDCADVRVEPAVDPGCDAHERQARRRPQR